MKIKFKPLTLEAIQWTGDNYIQVIRWLDKLRSNFEIQTRLDAECSIINMIINDEQIITMHIVELNDYIVIEPEGDIRLYDEDMIKVRFEVIE